MSARPAAVPGPGSPDPVRAEERRRLARELNDIVAHHLANVALRTMARPELADVTALHTVWSDLHRATGSALVELRLLAHVLEDDLRPVAGPEDVAELSRRRLPTVAAESWRRRLVESGRQPSYVVPAAIDLLALSVQATLTRTFDVTGEAALSATASGTRCSTTVDLDATRVTVRSAISLPGAPPDRTAGLGRALHGLRERVDLSRGHLRTGVHRSRGQDPEWVVTVTLPLG